MKKINSIILLRMLALSGLVSSLEFTLSLSQLAALKPSGPLFSNNLEQIVFVASDRIDLDVGTQFFSGI